MQNLWSLVLTDQLVTTYWQTLCFLHVYAISLHYGSFEMHSDTILRQCFYNFYIESHKVLSRCAFVEVEHTSLKIGFLFPCTTYIQILANKRVQYHKGFTLWALQRFSPSRGLGHLIRDRSALLVTFIHHACYKWSQYRSFFSFSYTVPSIDIAHLSLHHGMCNSNAWLAWIDGWPHLVPFSWVWHLHQLFQKFQQETTWSYLFLWCYCIATQLCTSV